MGVKYWSLMLLLFVTVVCAIATAVLFILDLKGHSVSATALGICLLSTPLLSTACVWCQNYAIPSEALIKYKFW